MKYKVKHVRFGMAVDLGGSMANSWDESRVKYKGDECIYDSDKMAYILTCKGDQWHIHCTNVSQAKWGEKMDNMAAARAAKAAKAA